MDSDCSHEIKRCLLLGIKAMIHLDNILKSRGITFLQILFHYSLLQDTEYSPLCYPVNPCYFFNLMFSTIMNIKKKKLKKSIIVYYTYPILILIIIIFFYHFFVASWCSKFLVSFSFYLKIWNLIISFRVSLLVMSSLNFLLSENVFVSPLFFLLIFLFIFCP